MEFGVLYDFRNPADSGIPTARFYAEALDHMAQVEALGFDAVWLTEHHFIPDGYLPSIMAMAGAVAARTTRVTIGTAVLLLPLHHPLRVAEDAAIVDNLSGGRLRLGVGLGYVEEEFAAFGVAKSQRALLLEESVEILRAAWGAERLDHHGRHFDLPAVSVTPKPAQSSPEIWIGARAERAAKRAARIGDGLLAGDLGDCIDAYRAGRAEAGRTDGEQIAIIHYTYPATEPEAAHAHFGPGVSYRFELYSRWYGEAGDLERDRRSLERLEARGGAIDSRRWFQEPRTVVEELRRVADRGVTSVMWFGTIPGRGQLETLPLFETIASDVMPAFR